MKTNLDAVSYTHLVALSDSARVFEYAVGKRRLAVVDVCDD